MAGASSPLRTCARRQLGLAPGELQPELRRLVHGLEEQLVVVGALVLRLLQREQLVGAEVALVVRGARPRQDRRELVLGFGRRRHRFQAPAYFRHERPLRRRREGAAARRGAAGDPAAAADAGRVRRAAPDPRRELRAPPGDRGRPRLLDDPLRAAGQREDDARPGDRQYDRVGIRGALGRVGDGLPGARGDPARPRPARRQRRADDPLPRRDPPLQQGAAGRAAAGGRGGLDHADRRHHREPLLRGQLGAPVALAGVRARAAFARGPRHGRRARRRVASRPTCRKSLPG